MKLEETIEISIKNCLELRFKLWFEKIICSKKIYYKILNGTSINIKLGWTILEGTIVFKSLFLENIIFVSKILGNKILQGS